VAVLREYDANCSDVTSASGQSHAVWQAVYDRHGAFMAKILDGGLSVEYEHCGVRLLQLAIESNNVEVVRLLIEREAAVNVPDMRGWTALHSAAYSGNLEVMLLILQGPTTRSPWTSNAGHPWILRRSINTMSSRSCWIQKAKSKNTRG